MGSCCSILNDTSHDVWITHGVNWSVFFGVTLGVTALLTGGASLLAAEAGAAVEAAAGAAEAAAGAAVTGAAAAEAAEAETVLGLTKMGWTRVEISLKMSDGALATALGISTTDASKMKCALREFQKNAKLIKPGEKYTWWGSLSLTMRVYVMNGKGQCDDRGCFTGWSANSENVYTISEYFTKLDL